MKSNKSTCKSQYMASCPTSTQLQCQQTMLKHKQRLPSVYSVKANQYTTSVPKKNLKQNTKAPSSTRGQAQPVHNFNAKRGCEKTKASISTQRQAQPVHNFSANRGCKTTKRRIPLVHSVKPSQYTTSTPKENVKN